MTPHGTLEQMADMEALAGPKRLAELFHLNTWESVKDVLRSAVHFDFGAAAPLQEHVEFGCDLLDRGMFRLPFEQVFYTSQALGSNALLVHFDPPVKGMHQRIDVVNIGAALDPQQRREFRIPMLIVRADGPTWAESQVGWGQVTKVRMHVKSTGKPYNDDEFYQASLRVLRFIAGAAAMLMSKDVEQRIEPAPAKLNAIRAKKGRLPIGERRIITVRPQHRAAYAQAAEDQRTGRLSPRMHLRRGHFRTLRHERFGEVRGSVIPVAPSIVNANDDAKPLAKTYQVEGV